MNPVQSVQPDLGMQPSNLSMFAPLNGNFGAQGSFKGWCRDKRECLTSAGVGWNVNLIVRRILEQITTERKLEIDGPLKIAG